MFSKVNRSNHIDIISFKGQNKVYLFLFVLVESGSNRPTKFLTIKFGSKAYI